MYIIEKRSLKVSVFSGLSYFYCNVNVFMLIYREKYKLSMKERLLWKSDIYVNQMTGLP